MLPVNIYTVTRIRDEALFNIVEKHAADDHDTHRIRVHEIESLRILVDALVSEGITIRETDGFYFGFTIPQIGKELDLIKVTTNYCLNIELKSQEVGEQNILTQLLKNRHYLKHLGKKMMLFTAVTDTMTCYRLSRSGALVKAEIGEIAEAVRKCNEEYDNHIERSFRPSEYLISPSRTPDKFLQGKYFLTPAQDAVRTEVLKGVEKSLFGSFFHITGRPGTGKTLLLYDLAKTLAERNRTLMIRCGPLVESDSIISKAIDPLDIISADDIRGEKDISGYEYLTVDEAHRLKKRVFDLICRSARENNQVCIFSTDPETVLTTAEKERNITGLIQNIGLDGEFVLSERLRMNKELYSFIMTLKHLTYKTDKAYSYFDISLNYANNIEEARNIIDYFRGRGYIFINAHRRKTADPFSDMEEVFDLNHLIGQEYDKVVMLMDSTFYYDEEGFLKGIPEPDPDYIYPNLFYQGITRVREKLSLVVLDAPELFRNILTILGR